MREWYVRTFRNALADGHTLEEIAAIVGVTLLILSALVVCAGLGGCASRSRARYDGRVWSCPHGTDTRIIQRKDRRDIYCVPQTKLERAGIQ